LQIATVSTARVGKVMPQIARGRTHCFSFGAGGNRPRAPRTGAGRGRRVAQTEELTLLVADF